MKTITPLILAGFWAAPALADSARISVGVGFADCVTTGSSTTCASEAPVPMQNVEIQLYPSSQPSDATVSEGTWQQDINYHGNAISAAIRIARIEIEGHSTYVIRGALGVGTAPPNIGNEVSASVSSMESLDALSVTGPMVTTIHSGGELDSFVPMLHFGAAACRSN